MLKCQAEDSVLVSRRKRAPSTSIELDSLEAARANGGKRQRAAGAAEVVDLGSLGQVSAEGSAMASEEEAESTAAMPPGAVAKEEEEVPSMPAGAFVKEEAVAPPMLPDALIKDEALVPPMPPGAFERWSLKEEEEGVH